MSDKEADALLVAIDIVQDVAEICQPGMVPHPAQVLNITAKDLEIIAERHVALALALAREEGRRNRE